MVSLTPHPIRVKPKKLLQIFEHKFGDSGHHISKTKAWSTLLENGQICLINHAFKYKHGQTGNKPISVWFNAYMRAAESGSKCCILQLKIELYPLNIFYSFIQKIWRKQMMFFTSSLTKASDRLIVLKEQQNPSSVFRDFTGER